MELDNLANGLIVDKDCCSHVQLVVDQVAHFLRLILLHLHQDLFHQSQKRYISKHNLCFWGSKQKVVTPPFLLNPVP